MVFVQNVRPFRSFGINRFMEDGQTVKVVGSVTRQGSYPYPYRLTMKSDKIDDSCSLSVTNNGKTQTYECNVTVSIPVGATFSTSISSWTHALIWEGSMLLACDE